MSITHLFLDDLRGPWSENWHHVKTYDECIVKLQSHEIEFLSLDHDLAQIHYQGVLGEERTGYHVVLWMAEFGRWPKKTLIIHTMNSVGRERMLQTARRYAPDELQILVMTPTAEMDAHTPIEIVKSLKEKKNER